MYRTYRGWRVLCWAGGGVAALIVGIFAWAAIRLLWPVLAAALALYLIWRLLMRPRY